MDYSLFLFFGYINYSSSNSITSTNRKGVFPLDSRDQFYGGQKYTKGTKMIFRTPLGGQTVRKGVTNVTSRFPKKSIYVAYYDEIRITTENQSDSEATVHFQFVLTEERELLIPLKKFKLAPGESCTDVFSIPGTRLTILAEISVEEESTIDVVVYGR